MNVEAVAVLEIEGKQFPLKAGRNYLVGRKAITENAAQLDIELESQLLDAKHALIRVSEDETKIHDLYSKSGTFLNKQRLDGLIEASLTTTGTIQLGELIGSIQFAATPESHDSSGFHDGPKNSSDIICSSPEPTVLSGSRFKPIQKNGLTSTPNGNQMQPTDIDQINTQCNFLVPPVPQRKSNATNNSRSSLSKPDETQSSFNSFQGNKTTDSFYIPETQQCAVRTSIGSNSSREMSLADSDADTDDMLNSRVSGNEDDNDFCIPETQEVIVPVFSSSQARKRYQAERAMLDANMPANVFAEEDENTASIVGDSQFRICTQDFNENDCFGDDDSNSSDLLAAAPCSIVIPRIQHDAVMLNNSGKVLEGDTKQETSAEDFGGEMSALQWSEQGSRCSTLQNEASHREGSCTPDFLDLPKEAQHLAKDVNDINCVPSNATNESKNVPVELPSTSFKTPSNPVIKVTEPTLFEDDDDLLPTQVFAAKPGDTKKATAGKCSPEYLTLSDKENILPAAAAILEAVDFMEATQIFEDAANINMGCSREDEQLTPPAATTITTTTKTTAAESTSNATSSVEPDPKAAEDDNDLLPTQIFPSTKPKTTTNIKTPAVSNKFLSSTLQVTSESDASDAAAFFGKMHHLTPPTVADGTNFLKNIGALSKKSSMLSNVTMSESPDIDLLLCTPQIIAENFVKPDEKAKKNLIAKQKTLFGDDSDEESDALELINAPKVSHDFDKLLPHLKKQQLSPKREEVEAKLHHYNRSFGEKEEDMNSKSKGDKKVTTRSRDERHMARDKQRDKKADNPSKSEKKTEETKKQTRSRAASKTNSEKDLVQTDAKKPDRKRRNIEALEIETAEKIIKKTDKQDKNERAKPATATKEEVGRARSEKMAQDKPAEAAKKETRSETEKPRRVITAKLKPEATVSKVTETTTRRTTRLRSQSASSNSEHSVGLPPRRMTRLKSRIEVESPIEPTASTTTTSVEVRKKTRSKKTDVVDKNDKQDSGPKELLQKSKKPSTSSSSQGSKSSQETKSYESGTSMKERRKRLRSTSSLGSAHCSTSSTTKTTTTTPDTAIDGQKLRQNKKIQVSMTMVDPEHFQNLAKNSPGIWTVAKDPMDSDILIMDKGNRTFKFLIAMAKGIPIVTSSWLEIVNKNRQITSMTEHLYADEAFEKRHKFSLLKSIQMARKQKLFANYHFLMTPGIRPQPDELEAIIKCSGGTVHVDVPAAIKDNQKLYLVTSKDDQKLWHKYRRLNNNIIIISSEGVMAAVMRQIVKPLDTNLLA